MENLLERKVSKKVGSNKGASIAGLIMGLVVGTILVVAVAIPVTKDAIVSANLSGTEKTVAEVIPIMLAIIPIVLIAQTF